jgi:hypothetical protein
MCKTRYKTIWYKNKIINTSQDHQINDTTFLHLLKVWYLVSTEEYASQISKVWYEKHIGKRNSPQSPHSG